MEQERFTDKEIAILREQIKRGNADAKAILDKKGVKPHPRILEHQRKLHAKNETKTGG